MARTKLRWEYPQQKEMHTIEVCDIDNKGIPGLMTVLRNCVHGYDEQGVLRKVLYCSRDGRFFVRKKDGWSRLQPSFSPSGRAGIRTSTGTNLGGSCYPAMRRYGVKNCHHLMAHAWLGPRPEGMECDHLNGNKLDWTADNLQWVTPRENYRRATIMRKLRKMGIDPKVVYIRNLKGIYSLEEAPLEYFLDRLPEVFAGDSAQLTIENINLAVATTLDETHDMTIYCSRCECAMIEDTEEHRLSNGEYLCDCCYDEMYG